MFLILGNSERCNRQNNGIRQRQRGDEEGEEEVRRV